MELREPSMRRRELLLGVAGAAALSIAPASPAAAAWRQTDARERFAALVKESQKADDALNPLRLARRGQRPTGAVFIDPQGEAYARQFGAQKRAELNALAAIEIGRASCRESGLG